MYKIYLAGSFGRKAELRDYALRLWMAGYTVVSRWLIGHHEIPDIEDPEFVARAAEFSQADYQNLLEADTFILFTEDPKNPSGKNRGGRHVELGIALERARQNQCIAIYIIGPFENAFTAHPSTVHFPDFQTFASSQGIPE